MVCSIIWFLFIRSSGFGIRTQLVYEGCAAPHILKLEWAGFEPMTSKILHSFLHFFQLLLALKMVNLQLENVEITIGTALTTFQHLT